MRKKHPVPLAYHDEIRNLVSIGVFALTLPFIIRDFLNVDGIIGREVFAFIILCASLVLSSSIYLVWTHILFANTPQDQAREVARLQYENERYGWWGRVTRISGADNWAIFAATLALMVGVTASVVGRDSSSVALPIVILLTAATAWATIVYEFALRYFRLDSSGETFTFSLEEEPGFLDFVSLAAGISAAGAFCPATPNTRIGMTEMRRQTYIAYGFNVLVVAMLVSIVTGFIVP